jgi:hypothetical protein
MGLLRDHVTCVPEITISVNMRGATVLVFVIITRLTTCSVFFGNRQASTKQRSSTLDYRLSHSFVDEGLCEDDCEIVECAATMDSKKIHHVTASRNFPMASVRFCKFGDLGFLIFYDPRVNERQCPPCYELKWSDDPRSAYVMFGCAATEGSHANVNRNDIILEFQSGFHW